MATAVTPEPKIKYGPQVSTNGVPNLFEPQTVTPFTPPPPGIDNLGITSVDTFKVPGVGEFTVEFSGYVRVVLVPPGKSLQLSIRAENCTPWDSTVTTQAADSIRIGFRNPRCSETCAVGYER